MIRRYRAGEEPAVWDVFFCATRESNARDYHPDLIERWAPRDRDMAEWAERLRRTNPFVAVIGDAIVGMAEIDGDGAIDYFYVHPKFQSLGVGKALLVALEVEATSHGVSRITLDASVTAHPFFLAQGFQVTEARPSLVIGHPAPNFAMLKVLGSEGASGRAS